jgi:Ca2+-binding RTX toxin-like protein
LENAPFSAKGMQRRLESLMAVITGTSSAETLTGTNDADQIDGLEGDDILIGGIGADALTGGAGIDTASYEDNWGAVFANLNIGQGFGNAAQGDTYFGIENLLGSIYNDILVGDSGTNRLDGGDGDDSLTGSVGADLLVGGNGIDTASYEDNWGAVFINLNIGQGFGNAAQGDTYSSIENLKGSIFDDFFIGTLGANRLDGADGNDILVGSVGADQLVGGNGTDTASYEDNWGAVFINLNIGQGFGNAAQGDTYDSIENVNGSIFDDFIIGTLGGNRLDGGSGNDTLVGNVGADVLAGGIGTDTASYEDNWGAVFVNLAAGAGFGNAAQGDTYTGIENLTGSIFDDALFGDGAANLLNGGGGNDILDGAGGHDVLQGGGGIDTFSIAMIGAADIDTIGDFTAGIDKIRLGGELGQPFTALASGTLRAETFLIGAVAAGADDYLLYNSATGALLYDADGSGVGAAVQIATLSTGLALTAADFTVFGAANAAPAITSGTTASVAENGAPNALVYQTLATDADGDRITYSLTGADASSFTIDAVTGAVRLTLPADFEVKATYNFTVVASDSNASTSTGVVLSITNVNEGSTPIINETGTPNNSRNNAQFIDRDGFTIATNVNLTNDDLPSATIHGSISPATDVDFYSIELEAGELLILDIDDVLAGTPGLDTVIRIFNSAGTEIGHADDAPLDPGSGPHPNSDGMTLDSSLRFRAATGGTYYFSVESFGPAGWDPEDDGPGQGTTSGTYSLHVSIGPPATAAQIAQENVEALISGAEWPSPNLTYAFPNEANDYPGNFGDGEPNTFEPFTAFQQTAVQQMLQHIASMTQLTFTQLFNDNEIDAQLRFAMTNETGAAHAYLPGNSDEAGSAWFNKDDFDTPTQGNYAWMGILHETGHALGLKHGHEFPIALSADHDSVEYSVMTYRSFPGRNLASGGYTNEAFGYPQTLMMYDIAALQQMYGANYGLNSGNSVYTWNSANGQMSINGAQATAPGANRIFLTVWDGGGTDTYDLSNYTSVQTTGTFIDLRPGEWTTMSQTQLANLGLGHTARGNVANALLFEGNAASLIENAIGSSTTDTIVANQATNQLTGNGGADTFRWMTGTDAGTGGSADTITDFLRGTDRIDLSNVDAVPGTGTVDDFAFIGTSAFGNVAGQLRYQVEGGNVRIQADLDGNGIADMEIVVNNNTTLAGTDFIF